MTSETTAMIIFTQRGDCSLPFFRLPSPQPRGETWGEVRIAMLGWLAFCAQGIEAA
jgi:hypothetical protein